MGFTSMKSHVDRVLCYTAGPYVHPDCVENTNKTIHVAEELEATGLITAYVPHLSLLWHLVVPHDADFWYDYDLSILNRCDCLYRIPGKSSGADNEEAFATEHKIPIFSDLDELVGWAARYLAED